MASSSEAIPVRRGEILVEKYRVESLLGEGGMGVVVAAEHLQLGHTVALKILRRSALDSPDAVERFLREARAAASLQSEHIARVSDVGTLDSGAPFMVMEFLEGIDLARLIDVKGCIPVDDAADYIIQACEALADAHLHGIVHRDLKPANLFLTAKLDGSPLIKVLDFGISKTKLGAPLAEITSTTAIIGSPKYMSPEQMQDSRAVDARSDIWSLGAILYEMLTGTRAFDAPTIATLCVKILQDDAPRPRTLRPSLPAELEAVVMRCLQKDPAARFGTVAELAESLRVFAPLETQSLVSRIARMMAAGPSKPQVPRADRTDARPSATTLAADGSSEGVDSASSLRALRVARRSSTAAVENATPMPTSAIERRTSKPMVIAIVAVTLLIVAFVAVRRAAMQSPASASSPPPASSSAVAAMIAPPIAPVPSASPANSAETTPTASTSATASASSAPPTASTTPPRDARPTAPTATATTTATATATARPTTTATATPTSTGVNDRVLEERR